MTLFSILLIENQLSIAMAITQAIVQNLLDHRLIISPDIGEAIADPKPTQVILLNLSQLNADVCEDLAILSQVYPDTPIILLQ